MSKFFKSVLSLFLAVFMVASLAAVPSSAAAALSKTSISLTKGYQTTLSVTGASGAVTWSTGDKSIATVSSTGKVVGKEVGTTYIYAKTGSTTLKCKVTVVAAKITSSSSSVSFDKAGESKTVTINVKGSHSGVTAGTLNKSVATASWVRPVEWDGDKIKLKITAAGEGSTRIKVYLKSYSSTCYTYINVNVGDYPVDDDVDDASGSTSSNTAILPYTPAVNVDVGGTYTLQVYSTNQSALAYSVSKSGIATVTAGSAVGSYRNYTIKGVSAGVVTLRLYDKNNTKTYSDVTITVSDGTSYYEIYTTQPSRILTTDVILRAPINSTTNYYMLVPANYDSARTNTLFAQKLNKYTNYEIYDSVPPSGYSYKTFTNQNSKYPIGTRYIVLPSNYDEVKYNTIIAKYNNYFEYYTVYSEYPAKKDIYTDLVETWTVNDPSTGTAVTRYVLLPYNYNQSKLDDIKNNDKNANSGYEYYKSYDEMPTVRSGDKVITYKKGTVWKHMVAPSDDSGLIKANDAIYKDTGVYEYNVMYSIQPSVGNGESFASSTIGTSVVYVLYSTSQYNNAKDAFNAAINNYADGTK